MMPVASSYGPFGRSVLLYNETVLLHTRDSQQILTQMQSSTTFLRTPSIVKVLPMVSSSISSISSYEAYLLKVLFKYNSQSSDGLGTLSMQFQCLLSQLSSTSSKHSLELLHALEIIMEVMHSFETESTKLMVDSEIWIVESEIRKFLSNIFRVVLAPALNAVVAIKITGYLHSSLSGMYNRRFCVQDLYVCIYVFMYIIHISYSQNYLSLLNQSCM